MLLKPVELVKFDPSEKCHRNAVALFMKRMAWADSPMRFTHDPEYGSVAAQVQVKLLKWYLNQEMSSKTAPLLSIVEKKERKA